MASTKWLRIFLSTGLLLFFGHHAISQSFLNNALLFSRTKAAGSARIQALGGAQTAIGGDYSSALSNPAGLGMFNRSEVTLSLANTSYSSDVSYLGTKSGDSFSKFNVPGLSLVLHYPNAGKESGFLGGSFAVSLTRINDINQEYSYRGSNSESSIIDYFIEDANFRAPDDPDELLVGGREFYSLTALAYNNYLLDPIEDGGDFYYGSVLNKDPDFPDEIRTVNQQETIQRKGAQYQWSIAYGANFSDKFFAGATLGITTLRYKLTQSYEESDFDFSSDPSYDPVASFRMNESLDIQGTGANFTLGLIYRPVDFLQIGASFVTPTFYQITDNYDASMESDWNDEEDAFERFDQPLLSEYNFTTPLRFNVGATFLSKYGFITADAELVNYSKAKYKSDIPDISYNVDNADIKSTFGSVVNYRVGAEFRYNIYRVRAGYNLMADPYLNKQGVDRKIQSLSGGVGVRLKKFYTDLAVISSKTEGRRTPYTASDLPVPLALQKFKNTNIVLTVGVTF
ncbi:MAG TPA: hypothetical protein VD816_00330 [Ohtaekwangia sp.]|nr:hypothetical protein [Ohtaekwangia sp.]